MKPAIDRLKNESYRLKDFGKIGIVSNQTSANSSFEATTEVIYEAASNTTNAFVTCIFGPQHGYSQTEQDNMKETPDDFYIFSDGKKVPLFSLYSNTREPTEKQLENVDTLVIDLQDIGCRVYTYMLTLAACMRAGTKYNKKVVVLDRVNPIGLCSKNTNGEWDFVEGNRLETKWHSFVGWYDIPMRHGLTLGELGNYFIKHDKLSLIYEVIQVENLKRNMDISTLKNTKWAMPSPNIPSWESAFLFPAFVTLEGTNISEGRGSTIPFQLVGAPWLDSKKCIQFLNENKNIYLYDKRILDSIFLRNHNFRPTFNKHTGNICNGIQFHIEKPKNINLFALGMCFLFYCSKYHKNDFKWANPGYEYNHKDLPINLILGTEKWFKLFENVDDKNSIDELKMNILNSNKDAQLFIKNIEPLLIYRE
jgi:uncharacterized protein YbbC (DUF1343 family)